MSFPRNIGRLRIPGEVYDGICASKNLTKIFFQKIKPIEMHFSVLYQSYEIIGASEDFDIITLGDLIPEYTIIFSKIKGQGNVVYHKIKSIERKDDI